MSFRTPLAQVRGLGSAKDGTHHWWLQRVTAIALIPLSLIFAVNLIGLVGADHEEVVEAFQHPFTAGVAFLVIVVGFIHLKLGLQVVIEDYVHRGPAKILLLLANLFGCVFVGLLCVLAVIRLAIGG